MRVVPTIGGIVIALALSGCVPQAQSNDFTAPSLEPHSHNQEPEIPKPPVWDDSLRAEAIDAAADSLRAFGNANSSQAEWWAAVQPHLTATAATAYSSVHVENVPPFTVTGPGVVTDESVDYLATVQVPTSAGPYEVLLQRLADDLPWKVERMTPEGTS